MSQPATEEKKGFDAEEEGLAGSGRDAAEPLFDVPPEQDARTIHQRMVAILAELPAIGKTSENTQQKFMYRSHDDVLNALNPLLAKHGVYVVPDVVDRVTERRETAKGSIMFEVNLHVRYTFVAADGSWMQASAWGEGTDMGDKSTNKAMTMAFKNVLAQAFAVSTAEAQSYDADGGTPQETVARGRGGGTSDRAAKMRGRIEAMCAVLDGQTKQESGTWLALVRDATMLADASPYETAPPPTLEEVGKYLKAQIDAGVAAPPEQIDLSVPF